TPAASASLSNRSANGSTPRARRRSSASRRAARTLSPRPVGSLIRIGVAVEDDAQALECEPLVVVVDRVAIGHHDRGEPTGRDHGGRTDLLLDSFDDAVHL